jgi:predicted GIY-YIG superfamily endonuclease
MSKHEELKKLRAQKWPRPWKLALIERMNPEWRDLYADLA